MLPQTIGDVETAFNEVAKNASDNRQSIEAYGSFYTKVGNAAKGLIKDQSELLQVTNTISQALVVGGANTMEAQSAMLQFGQALGSGVLQGDEFRSMAEAAPQYLDALAEAMGYPRSELKKLASEGKLSSKAVIEATLKMSTMFQEKFRQMPMTVGAATTIIGNKFKTMIAGLNRESQVVTNVANFLLNGFDKIEGGAKSFIEFVGGSTNAVKAFGIAVIALLSPLALGGFIKLIGMLLSPIGLIIGLVLLLGLAIDDIYNYLNGGESIFGAWIDKIKEGSEAFKMLAVVAMGVLGGIATRLMYTAGISALTWASNAAGAVASFSIIASGYIATSATAVATYARIAIASVASFAAQSGGSLAGMAAIVASYIALGVTAIATYVSIAAAALSNSIKMASAWLIALGPIGLLIAAIAAIGTAIYALWGNWDKVTGWMGDKVTWLIDKLKSLGQYLPDFSGGNISVNSASISPASMAGAGGVNNVTSNQVVNLTVPPGTPESQQAFLQNAAGVLKGEGSDKKMARDMATGGW